MTNYSWWADGIYGGVRKTSAPADGAEVFTTFAAARAALAKWFDGMAAEWRKAAKDARALRMQDAEPLEDFSPEPRWPGAKEG